MHPVDQEAETLRAQVFLESFCTTKYYPIQNEECLKPAFTKVARNSTIGATLLNHLLDCDQECAEQILENHKIYLFTNGNIHAGWYHDGDCNAVLIHNENVYTSTDAKKTENWFKNGEYVKRRF